MNTKKHEQYLNQKKFETIVFALDQLQTIYNLTGRLDSDDFIQGLSRIYDIAFDMGKIDVLNRSIASMFCEIDRIEGKWN
jgi:hypothetical protein